MFRREENSPPSTELAMSNGIASGLFVEGTTWPARIVAWTAPGWSIRYTAGRAGRGTSATGRAWAAAPAPFQSPKCFSSSGTTSSRVVSPTTIRVAFSGRTHCRWKSTSSSRPSAPIEASVPVPLNGIA